MTYFGRYALLIILIILCAVQVTFIDRVLGSVPFLSQQDNTPSSATNTPEVSIPLTGATVASILTILAWMSKDRQGIEQRLNHQAQMDANLLEANKNTEKSIQKLADSVDRLVIQQREHDEALRRLQQKR